MLCLASDEEQCIVAIVECWGSAERGLVVEQVVLLELVVEQEALQGLVVEQVVLLELVVEQAVLLELVVEQVAKPCEPSAVVAAHR